MPHVSERKLKNKVFVRMSAEMIEIISAHSQKSKTKALFRELLSQTERVMLAKRLAIVLMLKKKYSFEVIEKTLKVSPVTITKYWKKLQQGELETISRHVESAKAKKAFWDSVDKAIRLGMPKYGKGRWAGLYKK
jgi:Trp operon repressor